MYSFLSSDLWVAALNLHIFAVLLLSTDCKIIDYSNIIILQDYFLLCYSDLITYTLTSFHQETIQLSVSNPLTFHLG